MTEVSAWAVGRVRPSRPRRAAATTGPGADRVPATATQSCATAARGLGPARPGRPGGRMPQPVQHEGVQVPSRHAHRRQHSEQQPGDLRPARSARARVSRPASRVGGERECHGRSARAELAPSLIMHTRRPAFGSRRCCASCRSWCWVHWRLEMVRDETGHPEQLEDGAAKSFQQPERS